MSKGMRSDIALEDDVELSRGCIGRYDPSSRQRLHDPKVILFGDG